MQGILILIGGAEDRKDDKVVLTKILEKTNARNIVIIPTASDYAREVYENYRYAFRSLGIDQVEVFDIRYPDEVDREEYHDKLRKADLVYFSGGDQTKLIKTLQGSRLLEEIKESFFTRQLHIAGTSAGAAAAGEITIYDGDYNGFCKDAVKTMPAFGFLKSIAVDTHFLARERIPRLTHYLISGNCTKGIGIDEDTVAFIHPDYRMEVYGSGMVTVMNTDKITGSNFELIKKDEVYTVNNVRVGFLAPGTIFSLKRWMVLKTHAENGMREIFPAIFLNE